APHGGLGVAMEPAPVEISAAQLDAAFPFHLAFDGALTVVSTGRSLSRVCPAATKGAKLDACFRLRSPTIELTSSAIRASEHALFVLEVVGAGVALHGQMVVAGPNLTLFLGGPRLVDREDFTRLGLAGRDFALHDPTLDLLQLVEAERAAREAA